MTATSTCRAPQRPAGVGAAEVLPAGRPWPLGASRRDGGLNLALWAPDATGAWLCVFDDAGRTEQACWRLQACTDGVWHGWLPLDAEASLVYGWRVDGPWDPARGHRHNPARVLLDPHAHEVVGAYAGDLERSLGHLDIDPSCLDPQDNADVALKARVRPQARVPAPMGSGPRVARPLHAWSDTVLCEVHLKGASRLHPDVPAELQGTYRGLSHPALLAHWRRLGVTTLSLLPLHARADEARLQRLGLSNYWGYSSIGFLAPEPRYASQPEQALDEVVAMVDELHAGGLEVVLDVVFNHSAETDEAGPTLSLRGLANRGYYRLDPARPSHYLNWTGCGNCLDLSQPRVLQLVLDSLRHWVQVIGVDGFRFDLAPILGRRADGVFDPHHAFFAAVLADPVLAGVKLIAEPWDLGPGGYQLGSFPPGWAEWNDQFRDTMRSWWLRGAGDRGVFVHRFAASSTQFHHSGRAPAASVNFITAHDGFTLRDLVSYDHKHNHLNGEHNRDGHHHNSSWNCGVEGPTVRADVLALRADLQRALLASLLLSQGTPMLLAGDELGHSQHGNNNAYCQDNPTTWLNWTGADAPLGSFVARLLTLRRAVPALRQPRWLRGTPDADGLVDVCWWHPQGRPLHDADWSDRHDRALGIWLCAPPAAEAGEDDDTPDGVLLLVNPDAQPREFRLPDGAWHAVLCSAVASDTDPAAGGVEPCPPLLKVPARCLQVLSTPATARRLARWPAWAHFSNVS
ncbi:glycogen operon protein [Sphaerotilus hippei]|uniref:Glycogen operon protein n=1 Tax=Sphaerotilus hippei TaxID=744406 RepID=A0A318H4F1_9BURK|nr:glycogen debranching protein GlgX [Sphaerotilus hippei]PXW98031.1 glycogen operon protein [Sphaerotilus hippei]